MCIQIPTGSPSTALPTTRGRSQSSPKRPGLFLFSVPWGCRTSPQNKSGTCRIGRLELDGSTRLCPFLSHSAFKTILLLVEVSRSSRNRDAFSIFVFRQATLVRSRLFFATLLPHIRFHSGSLFLSHCNCFRCKTLLLTELNTP